MGTITVITGTEKNSRAITINIIRTEGLRSLKVTYGLDEGPLSVALRKLPPANLQPLET